MESENAKFKVGDWIISNSDMQFNIIAEITSIRNSLYYIRNIYGNEGYETWDSLRDNYHVWTIQDAKAGDVLSDGTTIFIFKDLLSDGSVMSYCDYDANSGESDAFCPLPMNLTCSKITPATKEQSDTLMKAMAEVGYVFDFEKKELKEIEQKHGWSEEDKKNMGFLCELLTDLQVKSNENEIKHGTNSHSEYYHNIKKWLKSLKERVQPQPKQEWKQENTDDLTDFENAMMHIGSSFFGDNAALDPNDTNVIKKQANLLLELVPSKEWGEECEKILNYLLWFYDTRFRWNDTCCDGIKFGDIVTFLKSLKDRYAWKPSDEHYELEEFAKIVRFNLTGISKAVQELFEAKYLQLTGNKMYKGFKD